MAAGIVEGGGSFPDLRRHWIAISSSATTARGFGVAPEPSPVALLKPTRPGPSIPNFDSFE